MRRRGARGRGALRIFAGRVMNASVLRELRRHAIIPPGDDGMQVKETRLIVDSRDRDLLLYPSSCMFDVQLPDDIDDIVSASLESCYVAFAAPQVNQNNNVLLASYAGSDVTSVTVPPSDYTGVDLARAMQEALNAAFTCTGWEVVFAGDRFQFSADHTFALNFQSPSNSGAYPARTIAYVMGFAGAPRVYAVAPGGTVVSPYVADLDEYNRVIALSINSFDGVLSTNNSISRCFTVVYKHMMDAAQPQRALKTFDPPLSKLAKLSISLRDRAGNVYDAQNQDHVFELVLTHYKSSRRNW